MRRVWEKTGFRERLAVVFKENGGIAFFGIESSGRDRDKHASNNLMLPGYGGVFGAFKKLFKEIIELENS